MYIISSRQKRYLSRIRAHHHDHLIFFTMQICVCRAYTQQPNRLFRYILNTFTMHKKQCVVVGICTGLITLFKALDFADAGAKNKIKNKCPKSFRQAIVEALFRQQNFKGSCQQSCYYVSVLAWASWNTANKVVALK